MALYKECCVTEEKINHVKTEFPRKPRQERLIRVGKNKLFNLYYSAGQLSQLMSSITSQTNSPNELDLPINYLNLYLKFILILKKL